jgi:outer membrane immunogenic protein
MQVLDVATGASRARETSRGEEQAMTNLTNLAATAAIVLLGAGAASAQSSADWAGFYLGGWVGSNNFDLNWPGFDYTGGDAQVGVYGGYNWAVGPQFIVGGEVVASLGDSELDNPTNFFLDNEASIRLRGGYVTGPATMVYGSIGAAQADFRNANIVPNFSDHGSGYVAAVGVEYMPSSRFILRLEASHARYGDWDNTIIIPTADPTSTTISIGAALHF